MSRRASPRGGFLFHALTLPLFEIALPPERNQAKNVDLGHAELVWLMAGDAALDEVLVLEAVLVSVSA